MDFELLGKPSQKKFVAHVRIVRRGNIWDLPRRNVPAPLLVFRTLMKRWLETDMRHFEIFKVEKG